MKPKSIKMALGNKGLIVDYNKLYKLLGKNKIAQLKEDLTLTKHKFAGPNRTIHLVSKIYKIITIPTARGKRKFLILPRFFQEWSDVLYENDISIEFAIRQPKAEIISADKFLDNNDETTIKLFDYQKVIHDYFIDEIYRPDTTDPEDQLNRGGVLVLDTGRGKTYTAGAIMRSLAVKTLIIAHNSGGQTEWEKMLVHFPRLKIGYYSSKKKQDGDVVIMVINSAMRDNFKFGKTVLSRDAYFKLFGFVIFDEVPCYLSEKRRKLFWNTNFKYVLGLTATPDENVNDWDPIYQMHLGPLIYAENLPGFSVEEQEWDYTVRVINYYGPPEYTKQLISDKTGMTVCTWMDRQLVEDPYRNQMILNIIQEWYDAGEFIFVFGGTCSVLIKFRDLIIKKLELPAYLPEVDDNAPEKAPPLVRSIMGGVKQADKNEAAATARIILTTYQYGTMSVSIGKMTRGIRLTSRRRGSKQLGGRLTRADGDPSIPRILADIVDQNTSLKKQYPDRRKDYEKKKYKIVEEKISYKEVMLE